MYCADKRVSLEEVALRDYGSVEVVHDIHETYCQIEQFVSTIPERDVPIFLGGRPLHNRPGVSRYETPPSQ